MAARWLAPALGIFAAIAAWQVVASLRSIDDLLLSSPLEVARALRAEAPLLVREAGVTLFETVLGLAIAVLGGLTTALVMHTATPLRRAAYPLLVASQAIPVLLLAPLLVVLFDFGTGPKVAIVALVCFFPVTVGALDGLRSVDPDLLKLMRSLGASRTMTLMRVEAPAALPSVLSGVRVAAAISVVGAVFAEWAGAESGLGRLVLLGVNQLETPRVYAGVVILGAMALALFVLVAAVERLAVPWAPGRRRG